MYKRYYPIKSPEDIFNMDIADKKKLVKWIRTIISDVYIHNIRNIKWAHLLDARRAGLLTFILIRNVWIMCAAKLTEPFLMTAEDIQLVNFALYRHKYVGIISAYCFPISTTE